MNYRRFEARATLQALPVLLLVGSLHGCMAVPPVNTFSCDRSEDCPPLQACGAQHICVTRGERDSFDTPGGGGADPANGAGIGSASEPILPMARAGQSGGAQNVGPARPSAGTGGAASPVAGQNAAGSSAVAPAAVCVPKLRTCNGSSLVSCSDDGQSRLEAPCANGCNASLASCNACVAGEVRCDRSTQTMCRSDGSGVDEVACMNGCESMSGRCAMCAVDQHACGAQCYRLDDPQHCGSDCKMCSATVVHGHSICMGATCDVVCDAGALRCDPHTDACTTLHYDFETQADADVTRNSMTTVSSERAHGGVNAARTVLPTPYSYNMILPFCSNGDGRGIFAGNVDLRGKTLQGWIYIGSGGASPPPVNCFILGATADSQDVGVSTPLDASDYTQVPVNAWTVMRSKRISDASAATSAALNLHCDLFNAAAGSWTATIYVDDLSAE